jgi:hypothetical protein
MARVVKGVGQGGHSQAKRDLGWDRDTVRKGLQELESGGRCIANYGARGGKRAEEHLPSLLEDIRDIVAGQSQTDPSFESTRLSTRQKRRGCATRAHQPNGVERRRTAQ